MAFLYNALENGWTIKKYKEAYKFTKSHQGAKEIFRFIFKTVYEGKYRFKQYPRTKK